MKKLIFFLTFAFSFFAYAGTVPNPILEDKTEFEKILDFNKEQKVVKIQNESFDFAKDRQSADHFLSYSNEILKKSLKTKHFNKFTFFKSLDKIHVDPGINNSTKLKSKLFVFKKTLYLKTTS